MGGVKRLEGLPKRAGHSESEEEVVEIQERIVLLEVRRAGRNGRILSRRILRFLTPEEEDDLLRRIAVRIRKEGGLKPAVAGELPGGGAGEYNPERREVKG